MAKWDNMQLSDSSIHDELLMKATKLPETRIKEWLRSSCNVPDNQLRISGGQLLNLARDKGFFKNSEGENHALFDLFQGYLKIRNEVHHESVGGTRRSVDTILLTNKILDHD